MKGVFIGSKDRYYQSHILIDELKKYMDYIDIKENSEDEIWKKLKDENYDYIFTSFDKHKYKKSLSDICDNIITHSGNTYHRLYDNGEFKEFVKQHGINGIITFTLCSADAIREYLDDDSMNILWHKWGLDLDILKDYKLDKEYDVMFSGKFSTYEFRRELDYLFSRIRNMKYIRYEPYVKTKIPYDEYAKNINKSWIGLGGCVQQKNQLYYNGHFIGEMMPKTFEIPACKTCLLNTHFGDEEELGFKDGENCILLDLVTTPKDCINKVKYYLQDKEELRKITEAGYKLVRKNHDIHKTVNELVNDIERIYG